LTRRRFATPRVTSCCAGCRGLFTSEAANDATQRIEIGERFRQAAVPTLTAPILERLSAANCAIAEALKAHEEACKRVRWRRQ
jgi:hypothetical protein